MNLDNLISILALVNVALSFTFIMLFILGILKHAKVDLIAHKISAYVPDCMASSKQDHHPANHPTIRIDLTRQLEPFVIDVNFME